MYHPVLLSRSTNLQVEQSALIIFGKWAQVGWLRWPVVSWVGIVAARGWWNPSVSCGYHSWWRWASMCEVDGLVANIMLLLSREMIVLAYGADRMFNLPHRGLSRQAMYGQQLMMRGWYCVSVALKVESRGCLIQCHIGDNHDGVNAFGLSMNEY